VPLPYEAFIGLRYLRAKRRNRTISFNTLISIAGVTIGVAALIATLGIMTGFKEDLQSKILGTNSHIIVTSKTGENIKDYQALTDKISSMEGVVAATPFIFKQVLLTTPSGSHGVILRGIDVRREVTVTEIARNLKAGSLDELERLGARPTDHRTSSPDPTAPEEQSPATPLLIPGIIIGRELSLRLGAFMGDSLNVVSPVGPLTALGMIPKVRAYRVVGVFESGMFEYDSSLAYVSIQAAQDFFNMGKMVTGIEVRVADIFAADETARRIELNLGYPYWARDWMKLNKNLFSALKLEKFMMFVLLVLVVVVASFNIVSTLTMIVVEKHREIAILKAMGATGPAVMRIFMLNGLVIGLVGTAVGIPLGYSFCWAIQTFLSLPADIYMLSRIPVNIKIADVMIVGLSAITITFLATIHPCRRAAKLDPAEALRYE
jgi:lipoprotein-releasing system permease protein